MSQVLVKTKEHNNVIEAQLSKEKEGQYATYIELVKLEGVAPHPTTYFGSVLPCIAHLTLFSFRQFLFRTKETFGGTTAGAATGVREAAEIAVNGAC